MAYLEGLLKPESEAKVQSDGSGEERTVSLQRTKVGFPVLTSSSPQPSVTPALRISEAFGLYQFLHSHEQYPHTYTYF